MKTFGLQKQIYQLERLAHNTPDLSQRAQERLEILKKVEEYQKKGLTLKLALECLEIPKSTYYRYKKAFDKGPKFLEPTSTKPKKVLQPKLRTPLLQDKILEIRKLFPLYGKYKITVILKRYGIKVSPSTVGRVLKKLFKLNLVPTAYQLRNGKNTPRAQRRRKYAQRSKGKPEATEPGHLVQIDTMSIALDSGFVVQQFTLSDVVSKWTYAQAYSNASANCGKKFLEEVLKNVPFQIKKIQVDGGSEFMAIFEEHCEYLKIPLFILPPRSPKLNGSVERCNGSYRYEFWMNKNLPLSISQLRPYLSSFIHHFNNERPHQALAYSTPMEYIRRTNPSTQKVS